MLTVPLNGVLTLDTETTTFNKGHPFDPRNFLVSYSYKEDINEIIFKYRSDPDFVSNLNTVISSCTLLVGSNIKFDVHWCNNVKVSIPDGVQVWDCQLAEFIYSGQENSYASLAEMCEHYQLPAKKDLVKEYWEAGISTENIPIPVLEEYNNGDIASTYELFLTQLKLLSDKQKNLVLLAGEDMKAIIDAERNGILWDSTNSSTKVSKLESEVSSIEKELSSYLPQQIPTEFNWDSGDQLSALLYGGTIIYDWFTEKDAVFQSGPKKGESYVQRKWFQTPIEFPRTFTPIDGSKVAKSAGKETAASFYQTGEPILKQLKSRRKQDRIMIDLILSRAEKQKIIEMIRGIEKRFDEFGWRDDIIHPQYNQSSVITGRLSSSKPNAQQFPPEVNELWITRYGTT